VKVVYIATLMLMAHVASGQSAPSSSEGSKQPVLRSTSTLVIVPALVRSASGDLVTNLDASHFRLTDNGVEQNVSVEQTENEPLAIVVLVQTGGVASSQFQNYHKLDTMLEHMLGSSPRKVALVTFDSRPEQIWPFPPLVDALYYFLRHPERGDHGAAILDAVNCAIGLLQLQPANFRRIILLLSQAQDDGSTAHSEDVVRSLAENGTTIYSLMFSPEETQLKDHSAKRHHEIPSHDSPLLSDKMSPSTSLGGILKVMREGTAAGVAALSGGEQLQFHDEPDLETKFSALADYIHNGYTLSFRPISQESGLHIITVQVVNQQTRLEVNARTIYWLDGAIAQK